MSYPPILMLLAVAIAAPGLTEAQRLGPHPQQSTPVLRNTCLITRNVARLADFYSRTLRLPARSSGPDYAEFPTGGGVLAIFSARAQEQYIPKSAAPADNKSVILEFQVHDVDAEYRRLQKIVKDWVKPPTTQPWGTRSIYFRDPDGNLVDFYAWVKKKPG